MQEIKAIIQPFMLEKVLNALQRIQDLPGLTISEVRGFGRTRGRAADMATDRPVEYVKKAKIEVVVPDALTEEVVRVIAASARTGKLGDGKIFVYPVSVVVRIRTGERGESAI